MLSRPRANFNLEFPDGLNLSHITVAHENKAMIELLTSNHDLDIEAIWRIYEEPLTRPRYWSYWDCNEHWGWDWNYGLDGKIHYSCEKISWTALEMPKRRLECHGETPPELQDIYNLL